MAGWKEGDEEEEEEETVFVLNCEDDEDEDDNWLFEELWKVLLDMGDVLE